MEMMASLFFDVQSDEVDVVSCLMTKVVAVMGLPTGPVPVALLFFKFTVQFALAFNKAVYVGRCSVRSAHMLSSEWNNTSDWSLGAELSTTMEHPKTSEL
jgi:hypothetical protein